MSEDTLLLKIVTIALAAYGALLSTIIAVWNVYREVTNRGRLRVRVSIANKFAVGVGTIATNKLWYKVTNVGRQPIWLTQIGGGLRNGMHFLIDVPAQFLVKLEPGQTFDDASSDATNLKADGPDRVTFLCAWDTVDKVHKLPRRRLRALLKEIRQLKPKQATAGGS